MYLTPSLMGFHWNFVTPDGVKKYIRPRKKSDDIFNRFNTIDEYDSQTYGDSYCAMHSVTR